ncbi:MAG TPA: CRTAC1 family protein [Roseiflexaceae bacterium]|nr:CRTAC1 family protein [Roseiflexaceae bacterium]
MRRSSVLSPQPAILGVVALLVACGTTARPGPPLAPQVRAAASARQLAHPAQPCSGAFVAHPLDHTTTASTRPAHLYESNGAGTALGDLDDDGDQDIVMANLAGLNAVLWNEGGLRFRRQDLPHGDSRAAHVVDADGDGLLDIVFTRRNDKPSFLRNTGRPGPARFAALTLPDVHNPFYTLTWGDLDRDGDLDLVAASYDADLLKLQGLIFQQRGGVGVFVYERVGERFVQHRLASQADALALVLPDLDGDGRRDIWVGNDFNRPDYVWLQGDAAQDWRATMPADSITENTMSLDLGDVDNDGVQEILAADMKPYEKDTATMARWLPMMKKMTRPLTADDPQHAENALLVRGAGGRWRNEAYERMLDSSGWSWSAKFGDLDRDGFLDVYVVNGMIAAGLFDHLPGAELVEPNMAFHNNGRGVFEHRPSWGLGATASGRGMSMADMDGDGDLDIVVNNLQSPALLLENRTCGGGSVLVELRQPSGNTRAIGATVALHTSAGTLYRDVRAASGYLSGDPPQVHFGVPPGVTLHGLTVTWPDGATSFVASVAPQSALVVTRRSVLRGDG